MKTLIVIPARYNATRFPGKPLADILGKPMIQHVYEQACQARCATQVVIATDDERIAQAVTAFGGQCVMTESGHASGTDRLVEVSRQFPADIYLNVQGDEPLVRPADIDRVAESLMRQPDLAVATLCHPISYQEALNPNAVKVVTDHHGNALYFSRAPIPFNRDQSPQVSYAKHIGLYGYRAWVIEKYATLPTSPLEHAERLEQLRLLQAGIPIHVLETSEPRPGVDTPECLERVKRIMAGEPDLSHSPLANLKLLITDVDGVLTDGHVHFSEDGETVKSFHVRDGLAIRMLTSQGIEVGVVSGRTSAPLIWRLNELGIKHYLLDAHDKRAACGSLMQQAGSTAAETAYIGDDLPDLVAFEACGVSFAVQDAAAPVKARATYTLQTSGGRGAFREVAEMILREKGLADLFETAAGFKKIADRTVQ